ncbi:hypothetical protein [Polaribacter sp.]|uniref:hypothetical protein n=1 Tax=Polaribacter sp. TaxID=1920175 RepID=UPI0025EA2077|nr:hypothetical protein [Polaribacter sp.]
MRIHKIISTLFHPIVIPTVGIIIYFLATTKPIEQYQKLITICIVFASTYVIPLLLLITLKKTGIINSYQLKTRKERKIPLAIMVFLFYMLGNLFYRVKVLEEISMLFYATALGLLITYLLLNIKIKSSIHLLSIGLTCGFFMFSSLMSRESYILIIMTLFLIAGLLASSRLHLKAHTVKEVYLGFFIGISAILGMYLLL